MSDEERLAGNMGGAVRVGDTVRRPVGPWTPAVHALLDHLADRLRHVPRVHGFDEQGREVLDYLPGRVLDSAAEPLSEGQLRSLVQWTVDFHAAVARFTHAGPWRYFAIPSPTLVGHNDIAPYNCCFDGEDVVGVFDWDLAGPTTPLNELSFIAWNCVPLWSDIGADRAAERLQLIADTYRGFTAEQILQNTPSRIQLMIDGIAASAAAGDPGMTRLVAGGEQALDRASLAGLVTRLPDIRSRLG
jgi:hypothetical protein